MPLETFRKASLLVPKEGFIWSGDLKLDWFSENKQNAFIWWRPGKKQEVGTRLKEGIHFAT